MISFTGSTRAGKRVAELARADGQAGVARARRQVGQRDPPRRRPREGGEGRRRQLLPQLRPDLHRAGRACSCTRSQYDEAVKIAAETAAGYTIGDPFDESTRLGPLSQQGAARPRPRLHREGPSQEGARSSPAAPTPPEGLRQGLLRRADRLRRRHDRHDDRAGGDLRAGAVDHQVRGRGRGRARSPTTPSTAWPAGCGRATRSRRRPFARKMRTGQVDINGGSFNLAGPVRRLQAVRRRPRARAVRARGVHAAEVAAALTLPGVSRTAVAVARVRARESGRPDRLFDDPYAAAFVAAIRNRPMTKRPVTTATQ